MAPGALAQVLRDIPKLENKNILVGYDTSDDACVYRISDELASVMTVDFFPPMVDDPYLFGQIAAANALSDIYAMGGTPSHAMNLLCFPSCLDIAVAGEILRGGADKAAEAGCAIAGGHTIVDQEPKYGLCVHGFVHPDRILTNTGALEGDVLLLTKRIGTGVLSTAVKGGLLCDEDIAEAIDSMRALNRLAAEIAAPYPVHACTDITGFGVIGHVSEMADGSALTAVLYADALPLLPHAREMAASGMLPGGAYRNRDHFGARVCVGEAVKAEITDLLYDPQTSGGLLLSVSPLAAEALLNGLIAAGLPAARIGDMRAREEDVLVRVEQRG